MPFHFSKFVPAVAITLAIFGATPSVHANSAAQQQLSTCLLQSTSAADKTAILQWTFASLGSHPDLKALANVSATQKEALDRNFATLAQRIISEQCATQTKAVIQADGVQGVAESFQALGQSTAEEILENPQVKGQVTGVLRYIDLNKLVSTFITPNLLNKLGL